MNKTVTINLGGIVFHIEETAFKILQVYLDSLKEHFKDSEDKEEIIHDIEYRLAEMFQQKSKAEKQVITEKDVEETVAVMGSPKDFDVEEDATEDAKETSDKSFYAPSSKSRKRFYRNSDDKVLGGVCSGVSAYFDIDPIWLRLLFVIVLFMGGTGFFIYFVLWVIMPEAKTRAQKIEMQGDKVSVENIEKSIKDEMDNLKKNFENLKEEAKKVDYKKGTSKISDFFERIIDMMISVATVLLRIIVGFVKIVFGFIAFIVLCAIGFAIIASITGISEFTSFFNAEIPFFYGFLSNHQLSAISLTLLLGLPLLYLVIKIIQSIFGVKSKGHVLGYSFMLLWLVGLICCGFLFFKFGTSFSAKNETKKVVEIITPINGVLYLDVQESEHIKNLKRKGKFSLNAGPVKMKIYKHQGRLWIDQNISLDIQQSKKDKIELVHLFSSRGATEDEAEELSSHIQYEFLQRDSLLLLNTNFVIEDEEKWRNQSLDLILKIPVGMIVHLSEDMDNIIYDIENVLDIYDGDMVGRKWVMRSDGLMCVDCDGLSSSFTYQDRKEIKKWIKKLQKLAKTKGERALKKELEELYYLSSKNIDEIESELTYVEILIRQSSIADMEETKFILQNIRDIITSHVEELDQI